MSSIPLSGDNRSVKSPAETLVSLSRAYVI